MREAGQMKIEFPRGDSYEKGFILKDKKTKQPIVDVFDEVYFTVKKTLYMDKYCFQKRMTDGGIVNDGNGHYTLFILPSDTDGMSFGDYICDVEFVKGDCKKTFVGTLTLTTEVTYAGDE